MRKVKIATPPDWGFICTGISESDQAGICPEAAATRAEANIIDFYDYSWCEYITPTTSAIINQKRGCSRIQQAVKFFLEKKICLTWYFRRTLYKSDFARLAFYDKLRPTIFSKESGSRKTFLNFFKRCPTTKIQILHPLFRSHNFCYSIFSIIWEQICVRISRKTLVKDESFCPSGSVLYKRNRGIIILLLLSLILLNTRTKHTGIR